MIFPALIFKRSRKRLCFLQFAVFISNVQIARHSLNDILVSAGYHRQNELFYDGQVKENIFAGNIIKEILGTVLYRCVFNVPSFLSIASYDNIPLNMQEITIASKHDTDRNHIAET